MCSIQYYSSSNYAFVPFQVKKGECWQKASEFMWMHRSLEPSVVICYLWAGKRLVFDVNADRPSGLCSLHGWKKLGQDADLPLQDASMLTLNCLRVLTRCNKNFKNRLGCFDLAGLSIIFRFILKVKQRLCDFS